MAKKKTLTIDGLGRMMQNQFQSIQTEMRTEFSSVRNVLKLHSDQFELIRSDITDIKTTLGPLVQIAGQQEREINNLNLRVRRLERKAGFASASRDD